MKGFFLYPINRLGEIGLTVQVFLATRQPMKQLVTLFIAACASTALSLTAFGGPASLPSGKDMKQVAPAPAPECNWSGFYIGLNVGGQWGHAEDVDHDYNVGFGPFGFDKPWGYDESGVVAGGQIGYNFQWNWLVLGIEGDGGFMNLEGRGTETNFFGADTVGKSSSDFYTTVRGRLGFACGHFLFYGTGGWIGVNQETRVVDDCDIFPCGGGLIDAGGTDFRSGWTGGGGIEYMIGCHWTIRGEYLRYQLDEHSVEGAEVHSGVPFRFDVPGTEGNIVRAALNYKF